VIDGRGRLLSGFNKPSSEYRLHLAIYEERADVPAVVHAHPPVANGFTFAGESLAACVVPEVVATLGNIPTTTYATPSTQEGADVIRAYVRDHDAVMLQRHGSVTVGATLLDAYHKLEKLEHTAQVLLVARQLGRVQPLSADEVARLAALRESLDLGPGADVFRACRLPQN
jgi:L-fuculose-phosphate aldolase